MKSWHSGECAHHVQGPWVNSEPMGGKEEGEGEHLILSQTIKPKIVLVKGM